MVAGEQGYPGSPQIEVEWNGEVIGSCCPDLIVSWLPQASWVKSKRSEFGWSELAVVGREW